MRRVMGFLAVLAAVLMVPGLAGAQVTTPGSQYSFLIQARGEADVYETISSG